MFVKDVTDTYQKDMTKVKWLFDLSALLIAVVLMLVLFRRFAFNIGRIKHSSCNNRKCSADRLFWKNAGSCRKF